MNTAIAVGLLLLSSAAIGQQTKPNSEDETAKPKMARVCVDDPRNPTLASADGVWEPDNPTKKNELVFEVVDFSCYRHGGQPFAGNAFCLQVTAIPTSTVHINVDWLRVVEWNTTTIVVVADSPTACVISQTTFDLMSKTVTAIDIRRPNVRPPGAEQFDSCKLLPDRRTFYLRDKMDYALFHKPENWPTKNQGNNRET